jgi:hypothetical protein
MHRQVFIGAAAQFASSLTTRSGVAAALVLLALAAFIAASPTCARTLSGQTLRGTVETNAAGLPGYRVSLYASFVGIRPYWKLLGSSTSDGAGNFKIRYRLPAWLPQTFQPLLFVVAEDGPVMLASAIGGGPKIAGTIVVNERTTVATGVAFAQFIGDGKILGNKYGMINAVHMAANLADPKTGDVGEVLLNIPNGTETSTLPTFNSLPMRSRVALQTTAIVVICSMRRHPRAARRRRLCSRPWPTSPSTRPIQDILPMATIRSSSCPYWSRSTNQR